MMKTFLLLYLCLYVTWAQDVLDYDDYDPDTKVAAKNTTSEGTAVDARGHRPVSSRRDSYNPNRYAPPPISTGNRQAPPTASPDENTPTHLAPGRMERITHHPYSPYWYRGRPTPAPVGRLAQEKEEQLEAGGCTHISEAMGALCPTGCELKNALLKQEKNVKMVIVELKPQIEELARSSNNVYNYVNGISNSLRERQRVFDTNNQLMSQYTDQVEEQHAYIKETVDVVFPSNIRVLQGVLDNIRLKIQKLEKAILSQNEQCRDPCITRCPIPVVSGKECEDIYRRGGRDSQMYLIQPDPSLPPYRVFCDQTTQNGGWVLIQNRLDGSVDFGRRWDEYRRGFGNIAFESSKRFCETPGEYWLGNDRISHLTKMGPTEVLIEMQDWTGANVYAQYQGFTIQTETSNYVMAVNGYSGNAGNCFLEGALELYGENRTMTIHNGMMFSTYDRDNDNWTPGDPSKQCAREDGGGWWYNRCHSANPNGRYYIGGAYTSKMTKHGTDDGVVWMNWKGSWYSLKAISMKIRPFFASR